MERWVHLEHALGGVRSLVIENRLSGDLAASVGLRVGPSEDDALSRSLWDVLRKNLGFIRASWAATLLSYPQYSARRSEAYVERLVVTKAHRRSGLGRALLEEAEELARTGDKKTVGLHVSDGNDPAIRLYEESGYTEISRQRSLLTGQFLGIREWLYLQKRF
jgi:ribosomal protein S18 acetylase RimI-like enzyme